MCYIAGCRLTSWSGTLESEEMSPAYLWGLARMSTKLLIFDLDGTLIDVRRSYREAIRRTVQAYFARMLALRGNGALITSRDVETFISIGGFDDNCELSAGLIRYLLSLIEDPPQDVPRPPEIEAADIYLRHAGAQVRETLTDLRERADVEHIAKEIRAAGGGLAGVEAALGELSHPLWFYEGDLFESNIIERLFEEFYLGQRFFPKVYQERPLFYNGAGLIEQEQLLVPQHLLAAIRKRFDKRLAIVTERPAAEARIALDTHNLQSFFRTVVVREDVVSEEARRARKGSPQSLRRPHPYSLLEAATRLDPDRRYTAIFVGDTPDDMHAVRNAKEERAFEGWGALWGADDPETRTEHLSEAGAVRILVEPTALLE